MEDQLISFETAKLAKEKGFDERINNFYNQNGNLLYNLQQNRNLHSGGASAPSQSLLQKWLREVHNIFIEVNFIAYIPDKAQYAAYIKSLSSKNMGEILLDGFTIFDKYEEALEQGLYEALKLI